ncbi:adenine nucleotide alpha hydrolase family protein [Candidatus Pacearchaeota archaeon]|nr:adenine nucleotide alpha hydrolase family protein [Candidatus Pacearchaeota archaeon]
MDIEKNARDTIMKHSLIEKTDKVVVALSGGKDSVAVLYMLHRFGYDVEGLMIDLGIGNWSEIHNEKMTKFCEGIGVPLTIVDLRKVLGNGMNFIKDVLKKEKNLSGCTVCGIIKRWILNKWAKKLGADKLVTGHNLDDEAQNVLMNFLKGNVLLGVNSSPATGGDSELRTEAPNGHTPPGHENLQAGDPAGPNLGLRRGERECGFVQRVKPLFFIPESEILKYAKGKKFDILYDKCPCAFGTYRVETREWMEEISDSEKVKIVKNFQKLIPQLRQRNVREIMQCKECGEPSRGNVCNTCKIFSYLD